jgi:hypothetical protein
VNQPYETALINFRSTLMLETTPVLPLTEEESRRLVAELESKLLASPYLGPALSRERFRQRFGSKFKLAEDYNLLSDTLSVVGLSDREQTARIGAETGAEMLLGVQVFKVLCDGCPDGDQVAVVGQMIHAKTGQLVWRATLMRGVKRKPPEAAAALHSLVEELAVLFNDSLRPKWHRERFKNLSPVLAGRPRPDIQPPGSDRSPFYFERPGAGFGGDAP